MLSFPAPTITLYLSELWRAAASLRLAMVGVSKLQPGDELNLQHLRQAIAACEEAFQTLPLSDVLKNHFQRTKAAAINENPFVGHPETLAMQFHDSFVIEMKGHLYFMITADDKRLFEDPIGWFEDGKMVLKRFATAELDIVSAGQCCALGQWTAAVFHAMRIAEHGLKQMARNTKIKILDLDRKEWSTLIAKLEDHISEMRARPQRTSRLARRIEQYSEAAVQFRHFKDAWRKHVAHARKDYQESEARNVLTSVKHFMRALF